MERVSKLAAAQTLLDRALVALIDEHDYLSAIVLASAAEDVLQGLCRLAGKQSATARARLVDVMKAIEPSIAHGRAHSAIRGVYNWLKHNDADGEPQELELDYGEEARGVVLRALENLVVLQGTAHPRTDEVWALELAQCEADLPAGR